MSDWLEIFKRTGRRCREAFLAHAGDPASRDFIGIGKGGDRTMVMDKLLEDIVLEEARSAGNVRVVTEEAGELDIGNPVGTLVVDPLDGSYNFRNGIPFCSTSLAYAGGDTLGSISVGYIIDLNTGDEYWAEKGKGAFWNGKPMRTAQDVPMLTLGVELHPSTPERARAIGRLVSRSKKIRCMGSVAINLAYAARGTHAASVDYRGLLRVLDSVAGILLVQEAGGFVTGGRGEDISGVRLAIDSKTDFIAACSERMGRAVAETLADDNGWLAVVTATASEDAFRAVDEASSILKSNGIPHIAVMPEEIILKCLDSGTNYILDAGTAELFHDGANAPPKAMYFTVDAEHGGAMLASTLMERFESSIEARLGRTDNKGKNEG